MCADTISYVFGFVIVLKYIFILDIFTYILAARASDFSHFALHGLIANNMILHS